jgi:hypothetical protein
MDVHIYHDWYVQSATLCSQQHLKPDNWSLRVAFDWFFNNIIFMNSFTHKRIITDKIVGGMTTWQSTVKTALTPLLLKVAKNLHDPLGITWSFQVWQFLASPPQFHFENMPTHNKANPIRNLCMETVLDVRISWCCSYWCSMVCGRGSVCIHVMVSLRHVTMQFKLTRWTDVQLLFVELWSKVLQNTLWQQIKPTSQCSKLKSGIGQVF